MGENPYDDHKLWDSSSIHSITMSPAIPYQYITNVEDNGDRKKTVYLSYENREEKFLRYWTTIIKDWKKRGIIQRCILYLELSRNGLLHFHGIIKFGCSKRFSNMLAKYKYIDDKTVNIKIDPLMDIDKWEIYCKKDAETMKVVIDTDDFFEELNIEWGGEHKEIFNRFLHTPKV